MIAYYCHGQDLITVLNSVQDTRVRGTFSSVKCNTSSGTVRCGLCFIANRKKMRGNDNTWTLKFQRDRSALDWPSQHSHTSVLVLKSLSLSCPGSVPSELPGLLIAGRRGWGLSHVDQCTDIQCCSQTVVLIRLKVKGGRALPMPWLQGVLPWG